MRGVGGDDVHVRPSFSPCAFSASFATKAWPGHRVDTIPD